MLCQDCQGLFNRRLNQKTQVEFSRTRSALQEGAANGCELCQSIYDGEFDEPIYRNSYNKNEFRPLPIHDTDEEAHKLLFSYDVVDESSIQFFIWRNGNKAIYYWLFRSNENSPTAIYTPTSNRTFSKEACELVLGWMSYCDSNHDCYKGLEMTSYPTRLINIGNALLPSEEPKTRLCLPAKENIKAPYMTLSHSWGKAKFLTLTSSNIDEFFCEIPYDDLSNVFKDAITATRKLGMQYLWIDSLCIIQSGDGSVEDWEHESSRMGDVYANAYCNIGASGTKDENDGLFNTRNPIALMPAIDVNLRGSFTNLKGRYNLRPREYISSTLESFPLLRRAWVFQERLLCSRMLHFGQKEILWECNRTTWSERTPTDDFGTDYIAKTKRSMKSDGMGKKNLIWGIQVVQSYSGCDMTFSSDLFPAFNGAALDHANRHRSSQEKYLAGLWLSDMPGALTWYVEPEKRLVQAAHSLPQLAYRAPSWSWASLNQGLDWLALHDKKWKSDTDVMAHELKLQSSNQFGPVIYASLTLRCRLTSLSWTVPSIERHSRDTFMMVDQAGNFQGSWFPDEYPISERGGDLLCIELLHEHIVNELKTNLNPFGPRDIVGITVKKCTDQDAYIRTGAFLSVYSKFARLVGKKEVIKII